MASAPAILLVDSDASDRTLSLLLVKRELPDATIRVAADALSFVDALAAGPPDVAVCAADLAWADVGDLIAIIKRRSPRTAVVLFGQEAEIVARALDPGLACDGFVRKSAAGYLALAGILKEVLGRAGRSTGQPDAAATPSASTGAPRSQQEMRDVALVVSHDVREPVQQIARLARRAQEAEGDQGASRTLPQVLECAERASGMLDRMIEYLTVTGRDTVPSPIDLNACLNQALDALRGAIDEAAAEIRAVSLPMSIGDEHQIVHLFQNLISNAIKFRGRERPMITISVEPRGDQWLLAFRDNGIGIPQGFTERIFELGKRLHTREEYPGTGVGLTLCRRIVERHGGRIWSESREGLGSTFYVLLPRAPADVARLA
jgi:signal transduction histidine kinase